MSAMGYFHVLLAIEGEEEKLALRDLREEELIAQFVKPYKRGETLLIGDKVVALDRVHSVRILVSGEHSKVLLARERQRRIDAEDVLNRESAGMFIVRSHELGPDDLANLSADVTPKFIKRLPGNKPGLAAVFANNPWMLAIVGGLVVTVVAAYITKKIGLT
jgi:hypothetical protein